MIAAILTTFFFSVSAVASQRLAMRMGGLWGNLFRLFLAALMLGMLVLILSPGALRWASFFWFFISGLIGFGLGDMALFTAYERIGSRMTILLNLCSAPFFAMILEWFWLGNGVGLRVVVCAGLILIGVGMAVRYGRRPRLIPLRGRYWVGIVAGLIAGLGQGMGAVVSRKAEEVSMALGLAGTGISAAFQRVVAGLLFAAVAIPLIRLLGPESEWRTWRSPLNRGVLPWLFATVIFGAVLGVSCFQWALQGLESGIVLAVVALTPIVMMPLTAVMEGDRPMRPALIGAVIAVAGVVLLNLWH